MYGESILQCDDSQVAAIKLRAYSPEAVAIVFLRLRPDCLLDNAYAPFLSQIGPLPQYLVDEVIRKAILCHAQ